VVLRGRRFGGSKGVGTKEQRWVCFAELIAEDYERAKFIIYVTWPLKYPPSLNARFAELYTW
jgi:hypothetical protein